MITLTYLIQPDSGAVFVFHCSECKRTTFMHDPLGARPKDGDLWLWEMCPDNVLHGVEWKFNTRLLPAAKPADFTAFCSIYSLTQEQSV